tara:strand:- start:321 stop:1709 length:1389 start_codon:yes stop_codon:yes gene_type:complete
VNFYLPNQKVETNRTYNTKFNTMLLTSYSFLFFFFPISLLGYFLFFEKNLKSKIIYLGFVSSYFYFLDNGPLLLILIFLAFLTKIQIETKIFNNFFYVSLSLTPLIVFKYSYILFSLFGFETPIFIKNNFPIGLSFFTFQAIAYYFDKNRLQKNESTFEIFTFLAFFPQLLAGPIVDISTFRNGIKNIATKEDIKSGIRRLSVGLLKKFLIADTLAEITTIYINSTNIENISFFSSFLLIFSYTFQIYFDFSGYCDIAIGLGYLFGFKLPENFNRPYLSKSFQEFWQRWHITLSKFFKDHVYIPLGGNRVTKLKVYRNLWITFFCTALWHGSSLTFLFWGFLHGLFMTIEKIFNFNKLFSNRFVTLMLIGLTWVPFFAKNLGDVFYIYFGLFNFDFHNDYLATLIFQNIDFRYIVVSIICIFSLRFNIFRIPNSQSASALLLLIAIVTVLSSSVDPFIYFKF